MNKQTNISLVGMMGSGKTTIAREISNLLTWNLIDLDKKIEISAQKSIRKIFEDHGENFFRKIESKALRDIQNFNKHVIATGGGIILSDENVKILREHSYVVWLRTSVDSIITRTKKSNEKNTRPLLLGKNKKEIKELLVSREKIYKKCCDLIINTDKLTIQESAHGIIECAVYHFNKREYK